jgi:hypothetical protein
MYCAVLLLADGSYEREFIDYLPTQRDIRGLEDDHSVYITQPSRDYYNNTERKSAKLVNLFKIGEEENE